MARLAERIAREIGERGPMPVSRYMALCLGDAEEGYYRRRMALGAEGDFVTAPEISQIFGEILGLWCAAVWQSMGQPAPVQLIELGPGRGTLMDDALRALRLVPEFLEVATVTLIEMSPVLRTAQQQLLAGRHPRITWAERLEEAPAGPTILLANEFLDALPVRQLVRTAEGWRERMVVAESTGKLAFGDAPASPKAVTAIPEPLAGAPVGSLFEQRPEVEALCGGLGARLGVGALAALFVDYGHLRSSLGDTLQAVRSHRPAPVLEAPGEQDLTAQVDFEALAAAARSAGLEVDGPMPQGAFLGRLGLSERAHRLMVGQPSRTAAAIESGALRLIDPSGMGSRFKAIGLRSPSLPPLPPF